MVYLKKLAGTLFGDHRTFKREYEGPIVKAQERGASEHDRQLGLRVAQALQAVIQPFFWRRTKQQILRSQHRATAPVAVSVGMLIDPLEAEAEGEAIGADRMDRAPDHGDDQDGQAEHSYAGAECVAAGSSAQVLASAASFSSASITSTAATSCAVSISATRTAVPSVAAASASASALPSGLCQLAAVQKNDLIMWCQLLPTQLTLYRAFLESEDVKVVLNSTKSPLAALTVLKKVCDHVHLASGSQALPQLGLAHRVRGERNVSVCMRVSVSVCVLVGVRVGVYVCVYICVQHRVGGHGVVEGHRLQWGALCVMRSFWCGAPCAFDVFCLVHRARARVCVCVCACVRMCFVLSAAPGALGQVQQRRPLDRHTRRRRSRADRLHQVGLVAETRRTTSRPRSSDIDFFAKQTHVECDCRIAAGPCIHLAADRWRCHQDGGSTSVVRSCRNDEQGWQALFRATRAIVCLFLWWVFAPQVVWVLPVYSDMYRVDVCLSYPRFPPS